MKLKALVPKTVQQIADQAMQVHAQSCHAPPANTTQLVDTARPPEDSHKRGEGGGGGKSPEITRDHLEITRDQVHGAAGISSDTPLASIFASARLLT